MPEIKFPKNFYWGAATSAHQVEGNNLNDWTEWEKENAIRLSKQAEEYYQNWQQKKFSEMFDPQNYISGQACDHYHQFEQDFDIAKDLNQNAHRFSIEWSRIEPEEGKFNYSEIDHYRQVLKALKKRNLEPFVTLWHYTHPIWLSKKGGWLNPKTSQYFNRYVKILSERLFDQVNYWITINEPNVYAANSFLKGIWPPQEKSIFKYFKVLKHLAQAHQLSYQSLHLIDLKCQVGIAKNNIDFKFNPIIKYFWNKYFLNKIKKYQDFIGLNYYFYNRIPKYQNLSVSDLDWQIYPKGIYFVLKALKKYSLPIYITENGLADKSDGLRIDFIKNHLKYIHQAIQEKVDVRGYFYWSLIDNFEWDKGFWPRFGLVEIDYDNLARRIRPSAFEYAQICKQNKL